jgi:uncharacterized protein (DUF2236 family)
VSKEASSKKRNFQERGMVWGLHREMYAGVLAAGLSFLLQAANQKVTQGFLKYSAFQGQTANRVVETAAAMDAITFGTQSETQPLLNRIGKLHQHIEDRDASLMNEDSRLWVGLSFIYAIATVNSTFLHFMKPSHLEGYYARARDGYLPLFGVDPDKAPRTFKQMQLFLQDEIRSGKVAVSQQAKEVIAPAVLFQEPLQMPSDTPIVSRVPRVWGKVSSKPRDFSHVSYPYIKATTGLLFPELRDQYGLSWTPIDEGVFKGASVISRLGYPLISDIIPPFIRYSPGFNKARKELANSAMVYSTR